MAARLIAGIALLAGLVVFAIVGLRSDETAEVVAATTPTTTTQVLNAAPENYGARKDLVNLDGWLNTDASSIDEFDGKVLLVEMWTFGCSNCKARIPHNQDLYTNLSRDDFDIIGVHAPEFAFEAEIPNIEEAIERLGVTWPVAIDTNKENFRAWQSGGRRFWPRTFVVDQNGDVRYDHIGEGRYEELAQTIQYLIDNPPAVTS
jgi:thiol-disulfide isomerase/thioredoxin